MPNAPLSTAFGRVVRARRSSAGLTQERLAELAGIHPTYVGLVERGERNPSLDIGQRIAEALDATLSELIAAAESGRSRPPQKGRTRK